MWLLPLYIGLEVRKTRRAGMPPLRIIFFSLRPGVGRKPGFRSSKITRLPRNTLRAVVAPVRTPVCLPGSAGV